MEYSSFEKGIQHQFDAFCKVVLKNKARTIYLQRTKQAERETLLPTIYELSYVDEYFVSERQFKVLDFKITVRDELMAEAIKLLADNKQQIILLYYFVGLRDHEISEALALTRTTVGYQRNKALEKLKKILEDSYNGKEEI